MSSVLLSDSRTDMVLLPPCQVFINSKYRSVYGGRATTDEEITGFLIATLFAGQHTSSITSSWTGFFMLTNQVQASSARRSRCLVLMLCRSKHPCVHDRRVGLGAASLARTQDPVPLLFLLAQYVCPCAQIRHVVYAGIDAPAGLGGAEANQGEAWRQARHGSAVGDGGEVFSCGHISAAW